MSFIDGLRDRAALLGGRIGFPEADEPRTACAILRLAREGAVQPVVIGNGLPTDDAGVAVEVVDPAEAHVAALVLEHMGPRPARESVTPLRLALTLLRAGELDGVVAGARASTAEVVRAGLQLLGTAPGTTTASGAFYMVVPGRDGGPESVLTFADAAVVPHPDAAQLAEIAGDACRARRLIVGDEPRVAFLSYSTHGSADGISVRRAREAAVLFRERWPDIMSDGEMQVDAALDGEVAARKAPLSPIEGRANVLVFPDLNSGNIGYKLVQRLARARALGPILQGLSRPLNDLSRGASEDEIVHVAYITALMAGPFRPKASN